jgi:BNR/Asp-box repeat protein
MNRVPASARSLVRIVTMGSLAGVLLASCATATPAIKPHVTGLPAVSISVPLSTVACTTHNSCVAIGTSNLDVSPTSVGEYRTSAGRWTTLTVPSADTSTYIQTSSCWTRGCLFVGAQSGGDLVWSYDATTHSIAVQHGPTGAIGIDAVSCYADMTCAVLDTTKSGKRFLTTDNGGVSWSSPVTLGVPATDSVTSLSCTSQLTCMASFESSSNGIAVYVTNDGGQTWTPRADTSTVSWAALTSLDCAGRTCVGLAKLSFGWRVERSDNLGKTWKKVAPVRGPVVTMACTTLDRCVVGGTKNFQTSTPYLATVVSKVVTPVALKYVPSPISDVACGSAICAAIGVTTVMTLKP